MQVNFEEALFLSGSSEDSMCELDIQDNRKKFDNDVFNTNSSLEPNQEMMLKETNLVIDFVCKWYF